MSDSSPNNESSSDRFPGGLLVDHLQGVKDACILSDGASKPIIMDEVLKEFLGDKLDTLTIEHLKKKRRMLEEQEKMLLEENRQADVSKSSSKHKHKKHKSKSKKKKSKDSEKKSKRRESSEERSGSDSDTDLEKSLSLRNKLNAATMSNLNGESCEKVEELVKEDGIKVGGKSGSHIDLESEIGKSKSSEPKTGSGEKICERLLPPVDGNRHSNKELSKVSEHGSNNDSVSHKKSIDCKSCEREASKEKLSFGTKDDNADKDSRSNFAQNSQEHSSKNASSKKHKSKKSKNSKKSRSASKDSRSVSEPRKSKEGKSSKDYFSETRHSKDKTNETYNDVGQSKRYSRNDNERSARKRGRESSAEESSRDRSRETSRSKIASESYSRRSTNNSSRRKYEISQKESRDYLEAKNRSLHSSKRRDYQSDKKRSEAVVRNQKSVEPRLRDQDVESGSDDSDCIVQENISTRDFKRVGNKTTATAMEKSSVESKLKSYRGRPKVANDDVIMIDDDFNPPKDLEMSEDNDRLQKRLANLMQRGQELKKQMQEKSSGGTVEVEKKTADSETVRLANLMHRGQELQLKKNCADGMESDKEDLGLQVDSIPLPLSVIPLPGENLPPAPLPAVPPPPLPVGVSPSPSSTQSSQSTSETASLSLITEMTPSHSLCQSSSPSMLPPPLLGNFLPPSCLPQSTCQSGVSVPSLVPSPMLMNFTSDKPPLQDLNKSLDKMSSSLFAPPMANQPPFAFSPLQENLFTGRSALQNQPTSNFPPMVPPPMSFDDTPPTVQFNKASSSMFSELPPPSFIFSNPPPSLQTTNAASSASIAEMPQPQNVVNAPTSNTSSQGSIASLPTSISELRLSQSQLLNHDLDSQSVMAGLPDNVSNNFTVASESGLSSFELSNQASTGLDKSIHFQSQSSAGHFDHVISGNHPNTASNALLTSPGIVRPGDNAFSENSSITSNALLMSSKPTVSGLFGPVKKAPVKIGIKISDTSAAIILSGNKGGETKGVLGAWKEAEKSKTEGGDLSDSKEQKGLLSEDENNKETLTKYTNDEEKPNSQYSSSRDREIIVRTRSGSKDRKYSSKERGRSNSCDRSDRRSDSRRLGSKEKRESRDRKRSRSRDNKKSVEKKRSHSRDSKRSPEKKKSTEKKRSRSRSRDKSRDRKNGRYSSRKRSESRGKTTRDGEKSSTKLRSSSKDGRKSEKSKSDSKKSKDRSESRKRERSSSHKRERSSKKKDESPKRRDRSSSRRKEDSSSKRKERSRSRRRSSKNRSGSRGGRSTTKRGSSSKSGGRDRGRKSSRDRTRSRSPRRKDDKKKEEDDGLKIDKAKLREIAIKNVFGHMHSTSAVFEVKPEELLALPPLPPPQPKKESTATGKSVEELTNFCKKIQQQPGTATTTLSAAWTSANNNNNNTADSDDDEGGDYSLKNVLKKVREVSSAGFVFQPPPVRQMTQAGGFQKMVNEELTTMFPVSSGSDHQKKEVELVTQTTETPQGEAAPADDKVFNVGLSDPMEISKFVSERAEALRKLSADPNDAEALAVMQKIQQKMKEWVAAKQKPGQFTGSTKVQTLSAKQLGGNDPRAWVKKDTFTKAKPVTGGIGKALLQRMGWKEGEGLGKNKAGMLTPIAVDIKFDRKGLISASETKEKTEHLQMLQQQQHQQLMQQQMQQRMANLGQLLGGMMAGQVRGIRPPILSSPMPFSGLSPGAAAAAAVAAHSAARSGQDLAGKHPVTALSELCTKRRWDSPAFILVQDGGPSHNRLFKFKAVVNGIEYLPSVSSTTKKQAKCDAAAACLQAFGILPHNIAPATTLQP